MNSFDVAREKYKPKKIKILFIAEAPPNIDSNRFFYFENVDKQDSLFWETMKVLYDKEVPEKLTKEFRNQKKIFLTKFSNEGFFLIDSVDLPFDKNISSSKKIKLIKSCQNELLIKIRKIVTPETKIVLVSSTVFEANFNFLKENKINVINTESLDFPGSGGQKKYKSKLHALKKQFN